MNVFRRKLVINPRLQYLMLAYSLTVSWSSIFIFFMLKQIFDYVRNPVDFEDSFFGFYMVFLIFAFATLAICLFSTILFSNRVAGPIYRLRVDLDRICKGEKPFRIGIRKHDFHSDLVASVNRLVELFEKSNAAGTVHPDFADKIASSSPEV